MIIKQLFSTKAYMDGFSSLFDHRIRIGFTSKGGATPETHNVDEIIADALGVSSSDLEKWTGDDSSFANLSNLSIYIAFKLLIDSWTKSAWSYEDGSGHNYLTHVNVLAQEVANGMGDFDQAEQQISGASTRLDNKFNPYQILGYSPDTIFDSLLGDVKSKVAVSADNCDLKYLLALALVTDYSINYAGLNDQGEPKYNLSLQPVAYPRLITPVGYSHAIKFLYINGLTKLQDDDHISVSFSDFDDAHPLMCAYASFLIRTNQTEIGPLVDGVLRADWQVDRLFDFYTRYASSISSLITTVSYADMIAVLCGRQLEATDEANKLDPYASAYNLANIWGAYLSLCKNSDQSLWLKYDCGKAESILYCPFVGKNNINYGFVNATSLPHLLPEISVSSFKSLRDSQVDDSLLNLILSNLKIASHLTTTGINFCDCDGEWWPSSSSFYNSTPAVIYLSSNATFTADSSAITANKLISKRIKKITLFKKRSYFTYSIADDAVKIVKKENASQTLMSAFLSFADNYKSGRVANDSIIDKAVKSNGEVDIFADASVMWQKSLVNANIELLTRQLIRSFDSSTRVQIDPTKTFGAVTSYWYDDLIKTIKSETGFVDCNWINSSLGPSITGNHLISLNHHAISTGCGGGGLQ